MDPGHSEAGLSLNRSGSLRNVAAESLTLPGTGSCAHTVCSWQWALQQPALPQQGKKQRLQLGSPLCHHPLGEAIPAGQHGWDNGTGSPWLSQGSREGQGKVWDIARATIRLILHVLDLPGPATLRPLERSCVLK